MAKFFHSLRFRLILLVLIAVVPAFGLIYYSAAKHRQLAAHQVKNNALGVVRAIASEQERSIENAHQFLVTLARVPQIREGAKAHCHQVLAGLLEPLYADLVVADRAGQRLCGALPSASAVARPHGLHHQKAIETYGFSVGHLRHDRTSGKSLLDLGYPLMGSPGAVNAVVAAALDLSWVTRLTVDSHIQSGMTFTLVGGDGIVLLRYPEGSDSRGKQLFADASGSRVLFRDAEESSELKDADHIKRLFASRRLRYPVNGQTVYAVVDIPAHVAFARAEQILLFDLTLLGIVSLIALSAAWFGADAFVLRRIRDLIAATTRVATGTLSARTTLPYGNSELGTLSRTFDHLAHTLETREAEMLHANLQLQAQRQQQRALYDLNRGITSTLDLSTVLHTLVDHVSKLYPLSLVVLNWVDQRTGVLESITQFERDGADDLYKDLAALRTLPSVVLNQQSPVAISNVQVDPRATEQEFFRRHHLFSYFGIPLVGNREILGVLSFYSREEREFSSEEMNFIDTLAREAAVAIYHSRLFQQTREQAIELEKSNKIKDEFLGVISHELRTPINIIMNYVEVLKRGTFGQLNPDQRTGLDKVSAQSTHLLSLIDAILQITKIEAGTVDVQSEAVDLAALVCEIQTNWAAPTDRTLTVSWNYSPNLPTVSTDRVKLKQIVANLLSNALKFTSQGSVTVSVRLIQAAAILEIEVADTGPGIPAEQLDCIFEKFHQVDSAMTRDYAGVGLGLYIVKRFVDALEGTIEVKSKLGQGSVFTVRLPLRHAAATAFPKLPSSGAWEDTVER